MSENAKKIQEEESGEPREKCRLNALQGIDAWCSRDRCIYWRLLEAQDIEPSEISNVKGCGLQHYHIVDDLSPEMAEWLLSMKKRLENITPESAKSRITFRRREE